ncbi:unnamed protein product [Rodentolepis nana]|uniref:General transcription factor IIF subunit 2 n=2 Tax=Rodentolepis nana TaxID=102285 RepID=A0A0R3T0V8_RODNA|nr:unnamed protein product [Rodentolepis nana]
MSSSVPNSSDGFFEAHALHPVDTSRAKDGVWLVKVPNYLCDLWMKGNTEKVVGEVVITATDPNSNNKDQSNVCLVTDDALIAEAGENSDFIPKKHKFLVQMLSSEHPSDKKSSPGNVSAMVGQELVVLCEEDIPQVSNDPSSSLAISSQRNRSSRRYSFFGRVNSRAECRPPDNLRYMKLKAEQLKAKNRAKHNICILEKPVQTNLPVSKPVFEVQLENRKKTEGKNLRREREDVLQDLFKAFERHQYYTFKDLVNLTKQPANYLQEILKEIGVFNSRPPHQNMWELKPEYRHYKEASKD